MSGSIGLSTAPFSNAEKVDIRRFLGYPAYGQGQTGFQSWRFFQAYGLIEFRMNNFAPEEYQVCREFLAKLYTLKDAVDGASANLDTDEAAVWKHNKNEVRDRDNLYRRIRTEFAAFMGVPVGDGLTATSGRIVI